MAEMMVLTCSNCGNQFERKASKVRTKKAANPCCSRKCKVEFAQRFYLRFWDFVKKGSDNECWEWQGARDKNGYGYFERDRKHILAHRTAYEKAKGPLADAPGYHGNCVRHICDNPSCCNPSHLIPGTHTDNMVDAATRGRLARKLTPEKIVAIRADSRPQSRIAMEYGLSQATVCEIKTRKIWKHLA